VLSRGEAQALVEKALANPEFVILADQTIERPWGWVFFYQSKRYLSTGDHADALAGNAPYLVNKHTGAVIVTGTGEPVEDYIANYERTGDPYGSDAP
jgi:hypothetical protein